MVVCIPGVLTLPLKPILTYACMSYVICHVCHICQICHIYNKLQKSFIFVCAKQPIHSHNVDVKLPQLNDCTSHAPLQALIPSLVLQDHRVPNFQLPKGPLFHGEAPGWVRAVLVWEYRHNVFDGVVKHKLDW